MPEQPVQDRTILFIHQNAPAQFQHLARHLAEANRVLFITRTVRQPIRGVEFRTYQPHRTAGAGTHPYLRRVEDAVLHGQAVARMLIALSAEGVRPSLIVGHAGWGETLFAKDIFPGVPLLTYFEFYYAASGADVGFDPAMPVEPDTALRLRTRNQVFLSALEASDRGITPTRWQHSRLPAVFADRVATIHDGIDTAALQPCFGAIAVLPDGTRLDPADGPVVTYVARNLEPYRGFPTFMQAARLILDRHPRVRIVAVGGDEVSYGAPPTRGGTWRSELSDQTGLAGERRLLFPGRVPVGTFRALMQMSAAHVYLTYPFVLSWSMLEAMAAGALVVGSKTPPVEEVIRDGENGFLVDFFDPQAVADRVLAALAEPERFAALRANARATAVERYDLATVCLPAQLDLLASMLD